MRPRKKDRHLPACVYQKHGAFYLVRSGKWTRLGADLRSALVAYARGPEALDKEREGTMPALIREAMPSITRKLAAATRAQYEGAGRRLEEIGIDLGGLAHRSPRRSLQRAQPLQRLIPRLLDALEVILCEAVALCRLRQHGGRSKQHKSQGQEPHHSRW